MGERAIDLEFRQPLAPALPEGVTPSKATATAEVLMRIRVSVEVDTSDTVTAVRRKLRGQAEEIGRRAGRVEGLLMAAIDVGVIAIKDEPV